LAEVGIESTLAGKGALLILGDQRRRRYLRHHPPELRPGRGVRKADSLDSAGSNSMAMRRSDSDPISQTAMASMAAANATGSAWKLPPDSASPVSAARRARHDGKSIPDQACECDGGHHQADAKSNQARL
jgi:hypothetical protein